MDTKAKHYGNGGAIRHMADGGLIESIKKIVTSAATGRKPDEAPIGTGAAAQAKSALTSRKQVLDDAERKAVGMAKGGKIDGPGGPTDDMVPIMASPGEFMLKAKAVQKLGVPTLEALNAVADGDEPKLGRTKRKRRGKRKMAQGGLVEYDPSKAYKPNFTMGGAPDMPEQARIGARTPGTSVGQAQYRPNFTMGANTTPNPAIDPVSDVRAKFNPANASPQAKAYMADRAANPGPRPAGAAPAAKPAAPAAASRPAAPQAPTGRMYKGAQRLGQVTRAIVPTAVGVNAVSHLNDYKINDPAVDSSAGGTFNAIKSGDFAGAGRSLSKGALETLMDVGSFAANAADIVVPGDAPVSTAYDKFLRSKFGDQLVNNTAAPGVIAAATAAQPAAMPIAAAVPAPAVQAPAGSGFIRPGQVVRNGNSYSGANVAGDISINGQAPTRGGFVSGSGDGSFRYGGSGSGIGGGASDQALQAARMAAAQRGDVGALQASYGAQGQSFGAKVDPIEALINNGRPMTTRKAAAIAQLQAARAQAEGATADRKLAQDRFDIERDSAKLDNKGKAQLSALQTLALDPATTPEQRKSALATYRALTGKSETQNRFTVVPGGQQIDPASGQAYTQPSMVIDNQTGQFVDQQGAKPSAQNYEKGKTYTDARGNKAKWDGQKFVPA